MLDALFWLKLVLQLWKEFGGVCPRMSDELCIEVWAVLEDPLRLFSHGVAEPDLLQWSIRSAMLP